jgi:hypothetical protein
MAAIKPELFFLWPLNIWQTSSSPPSMLSSPNPITFPPSNDQNIFQGRPVKGGVEVIKRSPPAVK